MSDKFFSSSTPKFEANPIEKAYADGYEAAAGDHKSWYLLDKNGEKVHIGDKVSNGVKINEVKGFWFLQPFDFSCFIYSHDSWDYTGECKKVDNEAQEKIKEELSDIILHAMKSSECFDGIDKDVSANINADDFISRILEAWKEE